MDTKLRRGEVISREDKNAFIVLKWRDTRDVRMLSSKHAPTMVPKNLQQGRTPAPGIQVTTLTNQPSTNTTQDVPQSSIRRRRS